MLKLKAMIDQFIDEQTSKVFEKIFTTAKSLYKYAKVKKNSLKLS